LLPAARMMAVRDICEFKFEISNSGFRRKRYPAWIRTMTKRTKISCATVTPRGSGEDDSMGQPRPTSTSRDQETSRDYGVTRRHPSLGNFTLVAQVGSNRDPTCFRLPFRPITGQTSQRMPRARGSGYRRRRYDLVNRLNPGHLHAALTNLAAQ